MTFFYKSIYNDKTSFIFSEDDAGDGSYHKIDRTKLIIEEVYQDSKLLHRLHLEKGQRLILRKRVTVPNFLTYNDKLQDLDLNEEIKQNGGEIPKKMLIPVVLIGYQETINGENHQAITAIFPDGHTEQYSKWKDAPMNEIPLIQSELVG